MAAAAEATAAGCERVQAAWRVLNEVLDPEVPALSVCDLGIVRGVEEAADGTLLITLTPTYSGCPATEAIERDVLAALQSAGLGPARATLQRAPAWSSDWISATGREKLRAYGIAPPAHLEAMPSGVRPLHFVRQRESAPACPHCASPRTERLSAFGSTACKALWRCLACREPFEYFKPI
jgi:ring-1,2-phenylacetyl-CoA epoxidase subunit PaaD